MTEKRRVFLNALMSTAQVVVAGAAFVVLYRYLLDSLGEELAGVWALVLAWTAAISVADLGLTGGAVKFVSKHRSRLDERRVVKVVETSILSVAMVLLVVLPAVYPVFEWLLRLVIEPSVHISDALAVLPYAIVSFWLTSVGGIVQSCIDGTQRVYVRNGLVMASALLYLGLAVLFVPRAGLIGLAQAQVVQAGIILGVAWVALRFLVPQLPIVPYRWSKNVFREMFTYSVNFQFISLAQMLFQPVTKSLISKFGGVGPVFFFEMAHKLVVQLRALIVMAHQSLVPVIAHWHEQSSERVQSIYRTSFRLLLYLVTAALPMLIGLTPIISVLWIGSYEEMFVVYAIVLFVGWFVNILVNPAYFGYMGIGRLRWNLAAHVIIGVVNVSLAFVLGYRYGGLGVVIAFTVAILIGSVVPLIAYHREYGIRWAELVDRHAALLALGGLGGLLVVTLLHDALRGVMNPWLMLAALPAAYALSIAVPAWHHPVRRSLQGWMRDVSVTERGSSFTR